jgi:MFS family permease
MTKRQDSNSDFPNTGSRFKAIEKINLQPYISGLLPLFVLAHFGHHVVAAILRPLMPMIRTDLSLNYTEAGLLMSAFFITSGISQLPAGWLADRFGPRLMVLFGVTGVAIAGFFIAFSNSFVTLTIFLVLSAIMGGGYHPASASAISSSVPLKYRGRALGLHLIGGSSTFWIVPLLAAPIAVAWGWRSSYLTLTIPTAILGILLYILISRRRQTQVPASPEVDRDATAVVANIRWRRLAPFIIMSVVIGTMTESVLSYLSLYAVDNLGATEGTAAILMAISPAVGLVVAPLGGYLSDRFGSVPVLLAISFFAVPFVYLLSMTPSVAALAILMAGIGIVHFMRMPISESYIAGNTPERRRATVLSLYFFAGLEGAGLLTPAIGNLIDRVGFYSTFTIAGSVMGVVVVICSFLLWRNRT